MFDFDFENLYKLRDAAIEKKKQLSPFVLEKFEKNFIIEYTHDSTAIEGNTISLRETKLVLEDKIAPAGKSLREIYELTNHEKAYNFVKLQIENYGNNSPKKLDENMLKDIHQILMENIIHGGIYRDGDVKIAGAKHKPPSANDAFYQMKEFFADIYSKNIENVVHSAAWTHAEFVKIHPFFDGNGRTARLIMNYRLMEDGFLPISIPYDERLKYYDALGRYDSDGELNEFCKIIFDLQERRLQELLQI